MLYKYLCIATHVCVQKKQTHETFYGDVIRSISGCSI